MIIPNFKALACALSHIKCWKFLLKSQYYGCFIAEDDIIISKTHEFQFEIEKAKKIIKKISDKSKDVIITFNSKQIKLNSSEPGQYYSPSNYTNFGVYDDDVEVINNPLIGLHFYYISKGMAKYLVEKLDKITYQIDIEIGILSSKSLNLNRNKLFINFKTDSLKQNNKFKTDIQYYIITENEVSNLLKLPIDVSREIYQYIPNCFKQIRKDLNQKVNIPVGNNNIHNLINYNYNWTWNGVNYNYN